MEKFEKYMLGLIYDSNRIISKNPDILENFYKLLDTYAFEYFVDTKGLFKTLFDSLNNPEQFSNPAYYWLYTENSERVLVWLEKLRTEKGILKILEFVYTFGKDTKSLKVEDYLLGEILSWHFHDVLLTIEEFYSLEFKHQAFLVSALHPVCFMSNIKFVKIIDDENNKILLPENTDNKSYKEKYLYDLIRTKPIYHKKSCISEEYELYGFNRKGFQDFD